MNTAEVKGHKNTAWIIILYESYNYRAYFILQQKIYTLIL